MRGRRAKLPRPVPGEWHDLFQAPPHPRWPRGWGLISDIVLSSRIFFLPTLSESIFVVSAANRASLVSKHFWCGRPCDLERNKQSSRNQGHMERAGAVERTGAPVLGRRPFLRRGQVKVTRRGLGSADSLSSDLSQPQVPQHSAGHVSCPW